MSNTVFENNLRALKEFHPDVAQKMEHTTFDKFQGEIVSTKTQAPSIRVQTPDTPQSELLHSAYDPIREAQRWAESIKLASPMNVVILGVGLGYHLLTLLKKYHHLLRHIVIIEFNPCIFRFALSAVDLRDLIRREGTYFLVGETPEIIPEVIKDARSDLIIHNCKFLPHTPSLRCYPSYYNEVRKHLFDMLTYDEVNMRTNFENQGRNQFNIYMNLPAITLGYALKDCENLLQGYPAVVCAAGPSLDKNIHLVKDLNDRAALFIVDTAQNTCKKMGILPDVVVTGDPTPLNFSHFEQIDSLGEAFFAFHPEVNRQITQKYIHHPYLLPLFDPITPLLDFLFDADKNYGKMERAMNVGHLAVNLAVHMGCSPILLAGFDFAFPRDGGTTHAGDAAVSRKMTAIQKDGRVDIAGKEGKAIQESGTMLLVPGYDGEPVPTTVPFSLYIRALEKTISQNSTIQFIDATEGGALFQGAQRMPLQEALQRYLHTPGVHRKWDEFRLKKPSPPFQQVISKLREGRDILKRSIETCNDMLRILQQWKTILSERSLDLQEAHAMWNEFEAIWIDMCGHPLFDPLLGGAVQHVYFLRQRTARAKDDSGNAFLSLVCDKYFTLVPEIKKVIDSFIQSIDLSIDALTAYQQTVS